LIDPDIPPRTVDPRLPLAEQNELLNKPCLSLHEFTDKLKAAYPKDPFFGKPENTQNLQFMSGYWFRDHQLVVPQADNLRVAVLEMMHAAPWAAHVGRRRTAYITKQIFWWPHMQSDIDYYVQHCDLCQRNKARHQNAENMLLVLPVPERPWEMIGVDFIPTFPKKKNGYDSISVILCHFFDTFAPDTLQN
jgi:hypothetical protein